jgi:hypothetical protein
MRSLLVLALVAACGGDSDCPGTPKPYADGDPDGHAQPLGAAPGEARAGRVRDGDLPPVPGGLITWKAGDFVLANNKVALVIEDAGDSDLYDPWGGRPVGLGLVEGGKLVAPTNFGEVFLVTGRSTVVTEAVTVIADGSKGGPAIIRARGKLHPIPFFEALVGAVFADALTDIEATIDYELAPDAEHVDVRYRFTSARGEEKALPSIMHAFMYTERTPAFTINNGFGNEISGSPYVAIVDDKATSWAYIAGDGNLGSSLSASGFLGTFGGGFTMPACGSIDRVHAQIVIGGPGVDGVIAAVNRVRGTPDRVITGTVKRAGTALADVHVHALDAANKYLSRARTGADGAFTIHVPADADVHLEAFRYGDALGRAAVGTGAGPAAIDLPATGKIHVVARENGAGVPVRVQVRGTAIPTVPKHYGELKIPEGRLHVEFAMTGDVTMDAPPGTWEVIVSRGYEYELVTQSVTVVANQTVTVNAAMDHSVDTTGLQCADFHIHTWRSNDSGDDATRKLAQAVADGLELPVRSDHEYVADFSSEIAALGVQAFAAAFGSIELTSMEVWGHMGVFPLEPDPNAINGGAPKWQTFPTLENLDETFETLSPPKVFDAVRARPEAPVVIINHPRGGANYFDYVGFNPANGLVESEADWDTKFTLVEVLNDAAWQDKRQGDIEDWFGLLKAGRKVFAVGNSDSHDLSGSPVGYPRNCIALGTDDPRALTRNQVRDQLAAGHSIVSGGVYVSAKIGTAGPGDTVTGAGNPMTVEVIVRAATWIDVDTIEVVVDGTTVDMIPIMPGDVDPGDPTIRYRKSIPVQAKATGGYVVIAAFGDKTLEPVHRGRKPFGMTNPIFVVP